MKIGFIGLGIMGRRMIGRLNQHQAFRITALWDPSPASVAAAAREAPGVLAVLTEADAAADGLGEDDLLLGPQLHCFRQGGPVY